MIPAKGTAEVTIEAVVIRKNGKRENLGVVSRTKVEGSALKRLLSIFKKHGNSSNGHRQGQDDRGIVR